VDNWLRTPDGFRDCLPGEYLLKRQTEAVVESVFNGYGYSSVSTPALEYAEVLSDKGSVDPRQMYRLVDRDGNVLALRADVTPPVARIVAANYSDSDMPLRFCYVQDVYRCGPSLQGRVREITQAGIELIGVNGDEADAETLAVAIDALLKSGLKDFRIDVGQARFLSAALEESGAPAETAAAIHERVTEHDFVGAGKIASESGAPGGLRDMMANLTAFCGGPEILDEAASGSRGEKSAEALRNLANIHASLSDYGFEKYVSFDLSMSGNMDYYTGIIFRGYTSGMGFSILDGGRYDNLMERFGAPRPAVGFIIKIHNLVGALGKQNGRHTPPAADMLVAWSASGRRAALAEAAALRKNGARVAVSFAGESLEANLDFARACGARRLCYADGERVRVYDAEDGR
jgi:ATP phosphoribosyltransferase regulatory subunit